MSNEITSPEYWDNYWSSLDKSSLKDSDLIFGKNGYFLKAIERQTGSLKGKTLLELGGAMSRFLICASKYREVKATAVDYAPQSVRESEIFFKHHGCDIELICADFFSNALAGRKFEIVSHWGVVEHQVDPTEVIAKSIELCADGGSVVFSMPQMRGPGAFLWKTLSPTTWEKHIYHTDEAIFHAFFSLGWKCRRFFFGPPLIHMTPSSAPAPIDFGLRGCQYVMHHAGRLVPYQYGLPYLSLCRGFVAVKAVSN
jgi:2-polyprenyl-3-methyl-5-hydroxy-6-metoxy-1,4-benzoquinol methylase